jgi:hypothetical protein
MRMARNIDYDFQNKLLNNIKSEWMKNGEQAFSKSFENFANDIEGQNSEAIRNKIFYFIKRLEKSNRIKVITGKGSTPNEYIFVNENINKEIYNAKEKCNLEEDDYVQRQNSITQDTIDMLTKRKVELLAAVAESSNYKSSLLELEYFGTDKDEHLIFIAKKGSSIKTIIEQLRQDQENETRQ